MSTLGQNLLREADEVAKILSLIEEKILFGDHFTNDELQDVRVYRPSGGDQNPVGFYVFPKKKVTDFHAGKGHQYHVEIKVPDKKMLDLKYVTNEQWAEWLGAAYNMSPQNMSKEDLDQDISKLGRGTHPANHAWQTMRQIFRSAHKFRDFWVRMGYDLLVDGDGSAIHIGEPQYIVLNPKIVKDLEKVR